VTITTVGFGDYVPKGTAERFVVMTEILSGILLFIGTFPLFASRLSTFKRT
jgi:uncharacterized membrane protein YphA (DoxX/SURF4 family)